MVYTLPLIPADKIIKLMKFVKLYTYLLLSYDVTSCHKKWYDHTLHSTFGGNK